jgi:hypothetical protein
LAGLAQDCPQGVSLNLLAFSSCGFPQALLTLHPSSRTSNMFKCLRRGTRDEFGEAEFTATRSTG